MLLCMAFVINACGNAPQKSRTGIQFPDSLHFILEKLDQLPDSSRSTSYNMFILAKVPWNKGHLATCLESSDERSFCWILQETNNTWQVLDTLNDWDVVNMRMEDINGDGLTDVILCSAPTMHGNIQQYPMLAHADGSLHLRHNGNEGFNLHFDTASRKLRSFIIGGVFTTIFKEEYAWQGDSMVLVRGVRFTPPQDVSSPDPLEIVECYHQVGDSTVIDTSITNPHALAIYDTALWKSY